MADRDITAEKYVDESIDQGVDFGTILTGGDSISSGAVIVKNNQGTDVTSTFVPSGASVNGTQVIYRLVDVGPVGPYDVFVTATLNTGEKIGQKIILTVLPI